MGSARRLLHANAANALRKIQNLNGQLNAVVHVIEPSPSMAGVGEASGGMLHGVPILVKDSIDVQDMPTVCGLESRRDKVATQDAPLIARLRRAGAAIIGKTNVPAGCLDVQTFNAVHGRTNNPYDVRCTPGGSSGGSAAAVASGMVKLAIGSDLAGSLRVPASFCGISSFKPTARRLSPGGHVPAVACMQNNLTLGALASNVEMLELFMQAATCAQQGHEEEDVWEDALPELPFTPLPDIDPREVRVVLTTKLKGAEIDERIVSAMKHFATRLSDAGVLVEEGPVHTQNTVLSCPLYTYRVKYQSTEVLCTIIVLLHSTCQTLVC
jgi:amidase